MCVLLILAAIVLYFAGNCFFAGKQDSMYTIFGIALLLLDAVIIGYVIREWRKRTGDSLLSPKNR